MSDGWDDYQRRRWLKPNARHYWREDAERFFSPGVFEEKYRPDQARDERGRWTDEMESLDVEEIAIPDDEDDAIPANAQLVAQTPSWRVDQCNLQYKLDTFKCQLVQSPICWAQASLRYANCLAGSPQTPPLNF